MAKFEVLAKMIVNVDADNLEEANKIIRENIPDAEIEYFYQEDTDEANYVVGKCEISGLSIFESDDYYYDEDGIMWLKKFGQDLTDNENDSSGLINITETF